MNDIEIIKLYARHCTRVTTTKLHTLLMKQYNRNKMVKQYYSQIGSLLFLTMRRRQRTDAASTYDHQLFGYPESFTSLT